MDPLKLLSRSTKVKRDTPGRTRSSIPSGGQNILPWTSTSTHDFGVSRKRRRGHEVPKILDNEVDGVDHLRGQTESKWITDEAPVVGGTFEGFDDDANEARHDTACVEESYELSQEQLQSFLKEHKLKITWLNSPVLPKKSRQTEENTPKKRVHPQLHPQPVLTFNGLKARFGISPRLAVNVLHQGYSVPTEVQLSALPLLLNAPSTFLKSAWPGSEQLNNSPAIDLLSIAPTGSGKTLAFLIPLLHRIRHRKPMKDARTLASAIILAPTKELASQLVNEGRKLALGTGIKITQMRKGMRLWTAQTSEQATYDKDGADPDATMTIVEADILVSTPGLLHRMILKDETASLTALAGVQHLILDEADVLLDPLFRDQSLKIWHSLGHTALRVSMWSATMGSNVEELARSTIDARRRRLNSGNAEVPEAPLVRLVVGLKDSAVPNVHHRLVYAATEQGKLMGLRQLLHPTSHSAETGPALRPPFLVFTQTIERAIALHGELLYDIPAEAGGISRLAVLHSDLSDTARNSVMSRFRKGELWVLITTDLLSRGVDFRGVNGVVNYDLPTSSAAYVHRVGRTGRAGRQDGVAVTLYSREDVPYLKHVANVIAMAEKQEGAVGTSGQNGMQQWLLDTLPTLSKQEKQRLKKRGIESRTVRSREKDPTVARWSSISTKSMRRAENNRRGAISASRHRKQARANEDEAEFGGFD